MNVQTSLNPADSSPKQPMLSPRTVPSCLHATGPNDKRADLTGPISSSGLWWHLLSEPNTDAEQAAAKAATEKREANKDAEQAAKKNKKN